MSPSQESSGTWRESPPSAPRAPTGEPHPEDAEGVETGFLRARAELAHERLVHLYEISKLLTRFESVDHTVPAVIAAVARTLPVRDAVVILETTAPGVPRMIVWQREGDDAERLRLAKVHATDTYRYLVDRSAAAEPEAPGAGPEKEDPAPSRKTRIFLPLVVDGRTIFGAIHLDAVNQLDELDLVFVNAVTNQLAIAIDRHALTEMRHAAAETARASAEAGRVTAEAGQARAEVKQAVAERAENVLRAEFAFAREVTAGLGEALVAVDLELRITLFNLAAEQLVGCSAEQALGRPVAEVLRIQDAQGSLLSDAESPFAAALTRNELLRSDEHVLASTRGEVLPISYTCAPLRRASGVWGAVLTLRDITEVKLAARREHILAALGATLSSSLAHREILSAVVRFAVPSLADLCFIDELGGDGTCRRLEVLFADEHKQHALAERVRQFAPRAGWQTPQASVVESGEPVLVDAIIDPATLSHDVEHAGLIRATGIESMMVVPLTARGRTFGALTLIAAESHRRYGPADLALAEEVGRRVAVTVDNARLYETAQSATRARDDLLAVVSHDLKNPLGVVLMSAALLLESAPAEEAGPKRPLAMIRRAAARMDRLIGDLLDAASIDAGQLALEPRAIQVQPAVADALEGLEPVSRQQSIRLESHLAQDLPPVVADAARLHQVLTNLIGNALKFTPAGGQVTVRVARSTDAVVFSVADTGPGIDEPDLLHLFDRFWQAKRTAKLGTGLGLFIVRAIVEAHGGRVWAESTLGEGSTFFFQLPVAPPGLAPPSSHSSRTPPR